MQQIYEQPDSAEVSMWLRATAGMSAPVGNQALQAWDVWPAISIYVFCAEASTWHMLSCPGSLWFLFFACRTLGCCMHLARDHAHIGMMCIAEQVVTMAAGASAGGDRASA